MISKRRNSGGQFIPGLRLSIPDTSAVLTPRYVMLFSLRRPKLEDELVKILVGNQVYMDCDLVHIVRGATERRDANFTENHRILSDPNLDYVPQEMRVKMDMDYAMFDRLAVEVRERMMEGYRNIQEFIRKFVDAGGKILSGTDAGSVADLPGISLHQNLELLVDVGLTPAQALATATRNFSKYVGLGWQNKIGTIQVGKLADLVILDADPLQNIGNTRKIHLVMKQGQMVDRSFYPGFLNPLPFPGRCGKKTRANPVRRLQSIQPEVVTETGPGFQMRLKGVGFVDTSYVKFSGAALPTEFVNGEELKVTVPAELITTAGTYPLTVYTPQGGGESTAEFIIVKFK
jgi:Amidohydrolase family